MKWPTVFIVFATFAAVLLPMNSAAAQEVLVEPEQDCEVDDGCYPVIVPDTADPMASLLQEVLENENPRQKRRHLRQLRRHARKIEDRGVRSAVDMALNGDTEGAMDLLDSHFDAAMTESARLIAADLSGADFSGAPSGWSYGQNWYYETPLRAQLVRTNGSITYLGTYPTEWRMYLDNGGHRRHYFAVDIERRDGPTFRVTWMKTQCRHDRTGRDRNCGRFGNPIMDIPPGTFHGSLYMGYDTFSQPRSQDNDKHFIQFDFNMTLSGHNHTFSPPSKQTKRWKCNVNSACHYV